MRAAVLCLLLLAACNIQPPEPEPGRSYLSDSPRECAAMRFVCAEGQIPFFNDKGCGCQVEVTSFQECAAAGFPVMESYPRQCRAYDETYVEDASP